MTDRPTLAGEFLLAVAVAIADALIRLAQDNSECGAWAGHAGFAKAEWTKGEANPRFVVTSLRRNECKAKHLYEKVYCARGDMENRIKECQLDLYADRTSAATMRANQLRLWFHSMAYVLDIRHLQSLSHGARPPGAMTSKRSRSSGLGVLLIVLVGL